MADDGDPAQSGRLADDHGQEPRHRRLPQARRCPTQARDDGARGEASAGLGDRPAGRAGGRPHRGRPATDGVHRLPSGVVDGGAGGSDPALRRGPHHRGDRAGVLDLDRHGGPAHRAGQAHAHGSRGDLPDAHPRGDVRATCGGSGGGLPDVQRGVLRHCRRRSAATGAQRGGGAAGTRAGQPDSGGTRGARTPGPDGTPGLSHRCPDGPSRSSRSCWPTRIGGCGIVC